MLTCHENRSKPLITWQRAAGGHLRPLTACWWPADLSYQGYKLVLCYKYIKYYFKISSCSTHRDWDITINLDDVLLLYHGTTPAFSLKNMQVSPTCYIPLQNPTCVGYLQTWYHCSSIGSSFALVIYSSQTMRTD